MQSLKRRKGWLICAIAAVILACASVAGVLVYREVSLNRLQQEALQTLEEDIGTYDERTIILNNTNVARAEELAEKLGAELRITENGEFASLTLPEGQTVRDVYEERDNRSLISETSLDYKMVLAEAEEEDSTTERLPSAPDYTITDPDYYLQPALNYINLQDTWTKTKGKYSDGEKVTVAIIDTGIDYDHPEFIDAAGNSIISEWSYYATEDKIVKDYVLEDGKYNWELIQDEYNEVHGAYHGTRVAGVIAAQMNNGIGITGIAPDVELLVIKCKMNDDGTLSSADCVFGLYYAIERDADIVSMSIGGTVGAPWVAPVKLAYESDIICVASAGNDNVSSPRYPAACEKVIGVGALAENSWEKAEYSNYGDWVDVFAPEVNWSTTNGGYDTFSGTSSSCPVVAAALALYKTQNKYVEFDTLYETLIASTVDIGDPGPDFYYGWGALDVNALIWEEKGTVTFDYLTDAIDETTQIFVRNHALQNIPEPERLYAVFDGWYYDIHCENEINYYEDIWTNDLTLYAKWVNEDETVPWKYVTLDDDTVELLAYTGKRRFVTAPSQIDGKTVTSIGSNCFAYNTRLRQVTLPNTIKNIGQNAFYCCSYLLNITIPESVETIGDYAFENCSRLSSVGISTNGALTSIGDKAFAGCGRLSRIDLPVNLQVVDGAAFYGDTSMRAITVAAGNSYFTVSDGALYTKDKSTVVYLPAALSGTFEIDATTKTVGIKAFAYSQMAQFVIPNGVTTLGQMAFSSCKNLTRITIPDSVVRIEEGAFCNSSLMGVSIPNTVTSMGSGVFKLTTLKSVTFEDGSLLSALGSNTFEGCYYLQSVNFGAENALSSIGNAAFKYCHSLSTVSIPSGVKTIGEEVFANSRLEKIIFESQDTLTAIGARVFYGCKYLKSISIPRSVETIGDNAFSSSGVQKVTFDSQSKLTNIYIGVFAECTSLTSIQLPTSVVSIDKEAFKGSGLQSFTVGKNVTELGVGVFAHCQNLTSLSVESGNSVYTSSNNTIYYIDDNENKVLYCHAGGIAEKFTVPDDVYIIDTYAFAGSIMQGIVLNEGLNEIRSVAFSECAALTQISFPQTLETIGTYAFEYCTSLGDIVITKNIINLARFAFYYDYNISSITIEEGSALSRLGYGVFGYTGITSFTIPSSVTSIAQYAFIGSNKLKTVTFAAGSTLESISAYMFDGATNLENVVFAEGSSIKSIQARAFSGMSSLKNINLEALTNLENIDNYAFWNCNSLQNVTLPQGVTYIGRYAFAGCKAFTRIEMPETIEYIGSYAFSGAEQLNVYFKSSVLPKNLQDGWDYSIRGYYVGVTEVVESGDWSYAVLNGGTVSIVKYNGTETSLVISEIDGKCVSAIGGYAFNGNTTLQSVTLPNTINAIYNYAFANTTALQSIVIPDGVVTIHDYAFYKSAITTLTLPGALKKIGKYAFAETANLTGVTIPNAVETIGDYAFQSSNISSLEFAEESNLTEIGQSAFNNTKIQSVVIPDSVTRIHNSAFYNTFDLTSLTLGNGELRIDANAFYNSGITGELYIPATTYFLGEFCFGLCKNLTSFNVAEDHAYYASIDGVLYKKDLSRLIACPAGKTGSFTIDKGIQSIAFGAFEGSNLSEIIIAEDSNLVTIGYRAFFGMKNLKSITIPDSVLSIDYYAFAYCESLEEVIISENSQIGGIYEGAFYNCASLKSFFIPKGVQELSDYSFYGCSSLMGFTFHPECELRGVYNYALAYTGMTELVLPESLWEIGNYAFADMPNIAMTELEIPESVTQIGFAALKGWDNLESLTIPVMYNTLHYYFGDTDLTDTVDFVPESLKSVTILDGTEIPEKAFYKCVNLTNVTIADSVTSIGKQAFYECGSLQSITFGEDSQLASFGDSAFSYCDSLLSIVIPQGVTRVSSQAFYYCISLASVVIPDGLTTIDESAFLGCRSLANITFGENSKLTNIGNYSFYGCSGLTTLDIPDRVVNIGDQAFSNSSGMTAIKIPASVTSIGSSVFYNCSNLTIVFIAETLPANLGSNWNGGREYYLGVKELATNDLFTYLIDKDDHAVILKYVGSATDVVIDKISGYSVTNIGNSAFFFCTELTSIVIPEGVTNIGDYAFQGCSGLTSIVIPESVTSIGNYAFFRSGLTSVRIPDGVTSIGSNAFSNCSLTDVTFGENSELTSISYGTFSNCYWLKSVSFGANGQLTSIGGNAFQGCSRLTSIIIPEGVTSIGSSAFSGCDNLIIGFKAEALPETLGDYWNGGREYYLGVKELATNDLFTYLIDKNNRAVILKYVGSATDVVIDEIDGCGVTNIGNSAFYGRSDLTSVEISDSVTHIGNSAFYGCRGLTSVVLYDGLADIGSYAFYGCSGLTSVRIPVSVTTIEEYAFLGCSSLTIVFMAEELPVNLGTNWNGEREYYLGTLEIGTNDLFSYIIDKDGNALILNYVGSETEVTVDKINGYSVTNIGDSAFSGCSGLTSVVLSDSVTNIGDNAFYGCSGLTSVVLSDGLAEIGSYAFYACSSLSSIVIPASVTNIDGYAFYACSSLTIAFIAETLPASLGTNWNGGREYYLGTLEIGTNELFNYLIGSDGNALILNYVGSETEVTVDKINGYSVTNIGDKAFYGCSGLTSVVLSDSVTNISDYAFYGCSGLTSVVLSDGLANIGEYAFQGCSSLSSVVIPASVTNIGKRAFYNCSNLTGVTIEDNSQLDSIGDNAFYNCISLINVDFGENGKLTSIGNGVFSECSKLTSIVIPESVTSIGSSVFSYCRKLSSVTFAGNSQLDSIGSSAFNYCSGLTSIVIPASVTSIGSSAFNNCSNLIIALTSAELPETLGSNWNGGREYYVGVKELATNELFTYLIDRDNNAVILKYVGSEAELIIDKINGCNVTSIGSHAFSSCSGLTSVSLPESVTSIGEYAFYYCLGLSSIDIPASVTSIGNYAFYNCSNLTNIVIPEGVTSIADNAFSCCLRLSSIVIPESVTSIGNYAFAYCSELTSVELPQGLKNIGNNAFNGCKKINNIVIPEGVTNIGNYAFENCSGLTSIVIPESVTNIGYCAFYDCTGLTEVYVSGYCDIRYWAFYNVSAEITFAKYSQAAPGWDTNWNLGFNGTVVYQAEGEYKPTCTEGLSFTLQNDGTYSVSGYSGDDTEVVIPDVYNGLLVTNIGNSAFDGCSNLTSVSIPETVTGIGEYAFSGCSSLQSIVIPEGVTSIGASVFHGCSGLISVVIPGSATDIGARAFYNCTGLTSVTIPDGVTTIGDRMFYNCTSLTSVVIPASVTSIEFSAFNNCSKLASIVLPDGLTSIDSGAFSGCTSLTEIVIPASVTSIGYKAFYGCSSLSSVTFGENSRLTSIASETFSGCSSLSSIVIPAGVTIIDYKAFYGCSNLSSVTFEVNSRLTSIAYSVFYNCSSLSSIDIPDGVTSIGETAFYYCGNLASIGLPDCLMSIGKGALQGCTGLTSIDIPDGVTSIGSYAFFNCAKLTEIVIPEGVTSIGENTFYYCGSLTSVGIPYGVKSIGNYAFSYCNNLASIEIPYGVTSIGNYALAGCSSLTSIVVPASVTSIGDYAFDSCSKLTNIVIPDSVTSIGNYVFRYCSNLTSFVVSESVTSIGNYAFADCSGLVSVVIPDGVTSIGNYAFYNCDSLFIGFTADELPANLGTGWNYQIKGYYLGINGSGVNNHMFYLIDSSDNAIICGVKDINAEYIYVPDEIDGAPVTEIKEGIFSDCQSLKYLHLSILPNRSGTYLAFPSTLEQLILSSGIVEMPAKFSGSYEIYCYQDEDNCLWADDWYAGCTPYYLNDWHEAVFFDYRGEVITFAAYEGEEVLKAPASALTQVNVDHYNYVFVGWDINGDGNVDTLPATLQADLKAQSVYEVTCKHDLEEWIVDQAPTCTESGIKHKECLVCGEILIDNEVIPANGHTSATAVEENRVEATCTTDGQYDSVVYCSVCGEELSRDTITLTALGHDLVHHDAQAPTCTEIGWEAYDTCSRCDYTTYVELPANGHTSAAAVEENRVEATCTTDGQYDSVVYCSACGVELSRDTVILTAIGHDLVHHDGKTPTCTEIGWEAYDTCSRCDYTTYAELPATGHTHATAVEENRVAATCTAGGRYDSVVYCSVCGEELSRDTITLSALGHDLIHHEAKAPTCTEKGWEAYDTCTRCNYTTYAEISATGHTPATAVEENRVEATCTGNGRYDSVVYCSACGEVLSRFATIIPSLGHDKIHHEAKTPTCTEVGWGEYDTCSRCDYTTYVEYSANGHTYDTAVVENRVEATCTEDGHYDSVLYCMDCGEEYSRYTITLHALGHNLIHHDGKTPTCTETGWEAYDTCSRCDYTTYVELPANGHTPAAAVEENRVEATCTENGHYDSVVYCSVCGEELSRGKITLSAYGHNISHHEAQAPTCTEVGWEAYDCCLRCGYTTYVELPATGHTSAAAVEENRVESTCTVDGHYDVVVYCSVCGEELSRDTIYLPFIGHDLVHHGAQTPTCTEIGWEEYDTCTRCNYTTYVELPANGHTPAEEVVENRVGATCTTDGRYEGVIYCTVCGEELSRQERTLPQLGHYLVYHDAQSPTCTEIGWEAYDTCLRCEYTTYVELPATGHTPAEEVVENRVEETCTVDGHYDSVVYCTVCGEELSRDTITLSALGHYLIYHDGKTPTCTEIGWEAYETCLRCNYSTYVELPATGHTSAAAVEENMVEATCTTDGQYDSVVYCSVCGVELSRDTVILTAIGHDLEHHEAQAPTCTEIGWEAYDTCSRCNYSTYIVLPANGHTSAAAVEENRVEVTCTKDGQYDVVVYCSVCGEVLSRETIILPAYGHIRAQAVEENRVEATCTENGRYDSVVYCSICGQELSRQEWTLPQLNHALELHEAKDPTCTEIGWGEYETCSRCDYTTYFEISANGHDPASPIDENRVEATCTADGHYESVEFCSVCGEELSRQEWTLPQLGHSLVHHDAQAPTCTEIGWEAYDTCSRCDYSTYSELPATGHDYDYENIIWSWAEDYSAATGTVRCKNDNSHTETFTAVITYQTTEATATEEGETVYTAKIIVNGQTYIVEKTVKIPVKGEPGNDKPGDEEPKASGCGGLIGGDMGGGDGLVVGAALLVTVLLIVFVSLRRKKH